MDLLKILIITFFRSHAKVDDREILRKFGCLREAYVHLIDLKYDNTIDFNIIGSANDRKKTHTCYICMSKFSSLEDLEIHKYVHSGSDESQTEEDYYCDDDYISLVNECEFLYKIERNMYRVDRGKKTKDPNEDSKQNENENKDDIEKENDENGCKTNLTVDDEDADKIEQINERREENTTDIEKDTTKEDNEKLDEEVFEPDATYRCESCDICFGDPFVINSHKVKCKFSCVTCVKSFKTKWAMLIHIIDHLNNSKHPDKKYICQLCKIKLSNSLKYKRHIWTHSKNAIKKIMEAKKKIQLRKKEAKQKMNELKSNQLTCDLCFDTFKTKSEFDAHAAFHKEMDLISQGEHLDVIAQEENETKHNKMKRISIKNMNDINNIKKIALPRLEINKMKEKKSPPDNFSLEVQRTGPLSYAVTYKLPAIQNKPTCIPIIPVKESIKQEPTDNTKHFLSVDDLVNKTSPTVNKNNVNIMYKSTPTSSSTNTCIAPTTIGTNHRYKTVTNSYIVNNNSNLSTGSIAQLDLSIRNNLNNISYINKQNNIQQISCNVNNAQLLNYNKTVTFPRQINPQIRLRNIRLPSGQIVVSNSAAITSSPRYYHPQNNQYPNRSINLNSQKPPQYSYEQANSNNIQNITNYNQYNQLIISDLRNLPEVEVDRTKFLPETSNSSTHIIASNPFDDTIVQPEANTKMFEDQDFISLNQFEELCKSKGTLDNITSRDANLFNFEKNIEQTVKTINNSNTSRNMRNDKEEIGIVKNPLLSEMLSTQNISFKKETNDSFETIGHNLKGNNETIQNTEISLSSLLSQDSSGLFKDIKVENTKEYNIDKYPRLCKSCPKVILNYTSLMCHNMEKNSCNYCPEQFCEVSQLKSHYYSQHRLLFCTVCKFLANNNDEFVIHKNNGKCSIRDDLWGSVNVNQQLQK